MFEKITEKYLNKKALKAQASGAVRSSLQSVKPKTQKAVLNWLDKVAGIKSDEALSMADRKKALNKLETSDVVSKFVRTLINQLADSLPGKSHGLEKLGKAGTKVSAATVAITRFALPKFIMTESFDNLSEFIRGSFHVTDPGDHHIPKPVDATQEKETIVTHRAQQRVQTKSKTKPPVRHTTAPRAAVTRGH